MAHELIAGGDSYSIDDAFAVTIGYAFGEWSIEWRYPARGVGPPPEDVVAGRWLYRAYDCTPPHPGADLLGIDVIIADALNGQLRGSAIAVITAIAPQLSSSLRMIPDETKFWQLPRQDVAGPPPEATTAWWLWRAWTLLAGAPGVGVAIAHKTLHHKRPEVFPLLDNRTIGRYADGESWAGIHDEINEAPAAWHELCRRFSAFATARGAVALSRLRLHDILVWTACTDGAAAGGSGGWPEGSHVRVAAVG